MPKTMDEPNVRADFTPPAPSAAAFTPPAPSAAQSYASPGGWFTCTVNAVGPAESGDIYITLTDTSGAFPAQWYYAVSSERKEMLATALVALANGFRVSAYLVSKDAYSQINRLYVLR